MFDPTPIWDAARDAGMLKLATFERPALPEPVWVGASFNEELDVDTMAHTTLYEIEYQTADVPGLAVNSLLVIGGKRFSVQYPPMLRGSGHFSRARIKFKEAA